MHPHLTVVVCRQLALADQAIDERVTGSTAVRIAFAKQTPGMIVGPNKL
jgi:hypothetical protein